MFKDSLDRFLHHPNTGSLILRLGVGLVFVNAGYLKVTGIESVITNFAAIGFSAGLAYFVSYAELIGGLALILGIFTRYAGVTLGIIMLVAAKIHSPNGFSLANGGYEYTFVLALSSFASAFIGAGKFSIDAKIKNKNQT